MVLRSVVASTVPSYGNDYGGIIRIAVEFLFFPLFFDLTNTMPLYKGDLGSCVQYVLAFQGCQVLFLVMTAVLLHICTPQ